MRAMILGLALVVLGGCGTIDGIGRDISGASNRVARWF